MADKFGYWREGQAYRTPKAAPVSIPICKDCGARHRGPIPNCNEANEPEPEEDDPAD